MGNIESNLDELLFDLNNPRFDGLASQREALEKIVLSQRSKLVNLAEDIVTEGMSPLQHEIRLKTCLIEQVKSARDGGASFDELSTLLGKLETARSTGDVN